MYVLKFGKDRRHWSKLSNIPTITLIICLCEVVNSGRYLVIFSLYSLDSLPLRTQYSIPFVTYAAGLYFYSIENES